MKAIKVYQMQHGGKREGAGRKPGTLNRRTRDIAEAAAGAGLAPLEVMLKAMRFHDELATAEIDKAESGDRKLAMEALTAAAAFAKDAAPYVHARLSSVDVGGKEGQPLVVEIIRFSDCQPDTLEAVSTKAWPTSATAGPLHVEAPESLRPPTAQVEQAAESAAPAASFAEQRIRARQRWGGV